MKEAFKPRDLSRTISDEDRIRLYEYVGHLRSLAGYEVGRSTFQTARALPSVNGIMLTEFSLSIAPLPHGEIEIRIDLPGFKAQAAIPSIGNLADMSANAAEVLKNNAVRVEGGRLNRLKWEGGVDDKKAVTKKEAQARQTISSSIETAKAQILGIADAASKASLVRLALVAYSCVTLEESLMDAISRQEATSLGGDLTDIDTLSRVIQCFNPIRISMIDDPDFLNQLQRRWLEDPSISFKEQKARKGIFDNTLVQIEKQEVQRRLFEIA